MKKLGAILGSLALLTLAGCGKYEAVMPTKAEEAGIYVDAVEGISDDFFRGVDISTVLIEEKSGAVYKNLEGKEEDLFKILADAGVNCVRVRVWVDPYDENGNGYGGGNCDAKCAAQIAKRAADYGMKTLVDFHYSDFWADPSKQIVPKAWEGFTSAEKAEAAYTFTYETLEEIIKAGGDVYGVQVGNETNNGMCGETLWSSVTDIMKGGSKAVREISEKNNLDIKVCVHFTNPESASNIKTIAEKLKNYELDYDVFGFSYYPYWHGSLENLKSLMTYIQETYDKDTMVVETAYMFTDGDGDGNANSVSTKDLVADYGPTYQSQANAIRDICAAVSEAGGLGVFYWEPAWIPVDSDTWELGSGWATSYAAAYDPNDAGVYYGGCAWDNQAMFSFDGTALPSLYVWKYLKYGATCATKIDFVNDIVIDVITGSSLELPKEIEVHYNNRSLNGLAPVTWNESDINNTDTNTPGEYTVKGAFEDGTEVTAKVKVQGENILVNSSFEESDVSMWTITEAKASTVGIQDKESDAYSGTKALHYWSDGAVKFRIEQILTGLENGKYTLSCYVQGGDSGKTPEMFLYANAGGKEYKEDYLVDGWINWKHPVISEIEVTDGTLAFGVDVDATAGAWGTIDDFYLYKAE